MGPPFRGCLRPLRASQHSGAPLWLIHGASHMLLLPCCFQVRLNPPKALPPRACVSLRAKLTSRGLGGSADRVCLMALPSLGGKIHSGPGPCPSPLDTSRGLRCSRHLGWGAEAALATPPTFPLPQSNRRVLFLRLDYKYAGKRPSASHAPDPKSSVNTNRA